MIEIAIIGAGGFGREVLWLISRINKINNNYKIIGFFDDEISIDTAIGNYKVIGKIDDLKHYSESLNICVAIGNSLIRKDVICKIKCIKQFCFPNLIDPNSIVNVENLGEGNIICANNICTIDYKIGNFNIINLSCTIGHDAILKDFITIYPNVNISGSVSIENLCEIGTGTKIIQGLKIGCNSIIGAGAVINKNIPSNVVAVGVPAVVIKQRTIKGDELHVQK
ncbi:transferase [Clostridiaceae bacterium OM02-2AC]|nr:transferase [Clostridiaceae bacterium OM02-2AC]